MYLAITPSQFNPHYVMLSDKTKNNVMENGDFFRLYYSDSLCNSNGLYIYFTLKDVNIEKYFNKIKCSFSEKDNAQVIGQLKDIEKRISYMLQFINKTCIYRIEEQLTNKYIKIYTDKSVNFGRNNHINLILKISGIWNNYTSCGITFRFYMVNHQ